MTPTRSCRLLTAVLITAALAAGAMVDAQDAVTIRVGGRYYAAPATVDIAVAVQPNAENRVLRIEADGETFFRSADLPLEGASAPKNHIVSFKNMPEGEYVVWALVLSQARILARARTMLTVVSSR